MRVIGIDPGSRRMGWGVVERVGTRLEHVAHGVIVAGTGELPGRLLTIDRELTEAVSAHAPSCAAMETIFFGKNAQSAVKLGHARGAAMVVLARAGLTIGEYQPTLVKRAVVGAGRASKEQLARLVTALLRLPKPPPEDAADALAVAITHANASRFAALVR
ncbi:MAG: crossover junction endodeoxyribonuclease RuvC [Polyangiaceae bacterium]